MLDPRLIRKDPDRLVEGLAARQVEVDIEALVVLEARRRELIAEADALKRERNEASERIAELKKEGNDASEAIAATRALSNRIRELDTSLSDLQEQLETELISLPNLPDPQAPPGASPEDNVIVETWGERPSFDYPIQDHVELSGSLGLIDFDAGTRIAGSGFILFTGNGARMVRALVNFMLEHHTGLNGYCEVWPPVLVRRESMVGTGQLPKLADDMYLVEREDLFLIPTAEVPVTNIHRESILREADLPIAYAAYSACFRREAGAHGADTRGLFRVHQFDKVELVRFCTPETSGQEHQLLLGHAREILERLGLHYRVVELCTGDLSFASQRCYDLELWAPASKRWLEVSSCSNFGDFQARRADIRYRRSSDGRVAYVHTMNASGVAVPRLLVALLESYQTDEGSVIVPEPLRPYMGGISLLSPVNNGRE
jgi:seryl-tRNA synthetase